MGDALRLHIEDAIESTTEKYFADAIDATIVLSRESFRIRAATANAPEYVLAPHSDEDESTEAESGADNPIIIAENQTVIENLTVSEAVMRLDLADAPAFVFRNSKHGGLGVVYRRDDGNIGWSDTPENEA